MEKSMELENPEDDHFETRGPRAGVKLSAENASVIVSRHLGHKVSCKSLDYVKRGYNNRTYIFTGTNNEEYIIRVTGKNWTRMKTENEVATIIFLRKSQVGSKLLLPDILGFCSDREKSGIGHEYILMRKLKGKPLDDIWKTLNDDEKKKVVSQIAEILETFQSIRFDKIGSLQFTKEVGDQLGLGVTLKEIDPHKDILVGPGLEAEAGPFNNYVEYLTLALKTEVNWLQKCEFMMEGDEGQLILTEIKRFIEKLENNPSIISAETTYNVPFVLTHGDFEPRNILVDEDSLQITGILDFEFAGSFPIDEDWIAGFAHFGADSSEWKAFDESPVVDDDHPDPEEIMGIKDYFLSQCESRGVQVPSNITGHSSRVLLYYLKMNICPWFLREPIVLFLQIGLSKEKMLDEELGVFYANTNIKNNFSAQQK